MLSMLTIGIAKDGCITCVGVYFPVGDNRHFFAHIFPRVRVDKARGGPHTSEDRVSIFHKVLRQLYRTEKEHKWRLDRPAAREKLRLCCPLPIGEEGRPGTPGAHVVTAIKKFLEFCEDDVVEVPPAEGFIVDLRNDHVLMLEYEEERVLKEVPPPEMAQYKRASQEPVPFGSLDDWRLLSFLPDKKAKKSKRSRRSKQ